jgi:hypothetical protein
MDKQRIVGRPRARLISRDALHWCNASLANVVKLSMPHLTCPMAHAQSACGQLAGGCIMCGVEVFLKEDSNNLNRLRVHVSAAAYFSIFKTLRGTAAIQPGLQQPQRSSLGSTQAVGSMQRTIASPIVVSNPPLLLLQEDCSLGNNTSRVTACPWVPAVCEPQAPALGECSAQLLSLASSPALAARPPPTTARLAGLVYREAWHQPWILQGALLHCALASAQPPRPHPVAPTPLPDAMSASRSLAP